MASSEEAEVVGNSKWEEEKAFSDPSPINMTSILDVAIIIPSLFNKYFVMATLFKCFERCVNRCQVYPEVPLQSYSYPYHDPWEYSAASQQSAVAVAVADSLENSLQKDPLRLMTGLVSRPCGL